MADIQYPTAGIRRGKKKEKRKKPQGKNIMAALFHRAAIITDCNEAALTNPVLFNSLNFSEDTPG